MAIIKKKIWPEYFDLVLLGKKTYELRLNDFPINEGDTLVLEEWDPKAKAYTGRKVEKKVGYVGKFKWEDLQKFWPEEDIKKNGLQIVSIE
jgi:ASC-1-like (ASCH) protein